MTDEGIPQRGPRVIRDWPGKVQSPHFRAGVVRHRGYLHGGSSWFLSTLQRSLACSLDPFKYKVGVVMGRASLLWVSIGIALAVPAAAQPLSTPLVPEKPVPGELPKLGASKTRAPAVADLHVSS